MRPCRLCGGSGTLVCYDVVTGKRLYEETCWECDGFGYEPEPMGCALALAGAM